MKNLIQITLFVLTLTGNLVTPLTLLANENPQKTAATKSYDPLKKAQQSYRQIKNPEAVVPVQCYTKTEGYSNPCWTCHTQERFPNMRGDFDLQWTYSFSTVGQTNQWFNLFKDRSAEWKKINDAKALAYVKQDNYSKLKNYMEKLDPKKIPWIST